MEVFASESRVFAPRHVLGWTLFTLSAGFVNAGSLVACRNFATHITGSVTNLAADASVASDYVLVIALFIGGAMLGVLVAETLKARPKLAFALPVLISFTILVTIAVAG